MGELFQAAPDQIRAAAEIDHASRQAFIHRHIGLARKRVSWVKTRPVSPDAFLVAERPSERLSKGDATVFDRVMHIHLQIAAATECQIDDGMPGQQCQHVIEKGYAGFDRGLA